VARVTKVSLLDLGIGGRTALAVVYLAVQGALLLTAAERPDGVFSFQMFNESSTIAIRLSRRAADAEGGTRVVPIDGTWEARDRQGAQHTFHWNDRVRDPILVTLGRPVHASYGVAAQLFRLQKALDDVVDHLELDAETRGLVADVEIRRNGHAPYETRLESRARYP
jgi:hypothetical protein